MRILFCYSDSPSEWNSSYYRSYLPCYEIRSRAEELGAEAALMPIQKFANPDEVAQKKLEEADVIVVERNFFGAVLGAITKWRNLGKLVVADFDDAYNLITEDNPAWGFWTLGISQYGPLQVHPLAQFMAGLSAANLVTPASPLLTADWMQFNLRTTTIPNCPSMRELPVARRHQDFIRIGWSGSATHFQSFILSGALVALAYLLSSPDYSHVTLELGGDRRVHKKILELGAKPDRVNYRPWDEDRNKWFERQASFDLAVIPLATPYDMRRTPIKALELMAMGVPILASSMDGKGPYDPFAPAMLLTTNGVDSWYTSLRAAVDNIDDLRRTADTIGIVTARANAIENRIQERIKIYKEAM